jgi:hypothetical protein
MATIQVPKPPKEAMNPDRPVSSLLRAQILHLHEVEKNLPPGQRTKIYIHAIKTERQAAEYIRQVTSAVFKAHAGNIAGKPRRRAKKAAAEPPAAVSAGAETVSSDKGSAEPSGAVPGKEQI